MSCKLYKRYYLLSIYNCNISVLCQSQTLSKNKHSDNHQRCFVFSIFVFREKLQCVITCHSTELLISEWEFKLELNPDIDWPKNENRLNFLFDGIQIQKVIRPFESLLYIHCICSTCVYVMYIHSIQRKYYLNQTSCDQCQLTNIYDYNSYNWNDKNKSEACCLMWQLCLWETY